MLFAAGCGGGGGGGGSTPPAAATSASSTSSIGTSGGSVSVNFGIYTATVTVPAGALPTTTSVTLTLYGTGKGPHTLQSVGRSTKSLGTGATELAEVALSTGGEALALPVKLSLTGVAPLASGTVIMLAGYGTTAGFTNVDTVTLLSNVASEDDNVHYPGASLGSNTVYGFYEIVSANVGPTPTPVVTVTETNPTATSAQFTGVETNGNGFPYLVTAFTYTTSNSSTLGNLSTSGLLTNPILNGFGTVTATDLTSARNNPSGSVTVGDQGTAFTFTGTISSTQQLLAPPTTAPQTNSGTVTVSTTVNSYATAPPNVQANSTSTEVDTYARQTITTTTQTVDNYGIGAPESVSVASTDATDSNGAEYINTYGTGNGLLDVLPETTGPFGPNNAALVYQENDPANYSESRTTNANGSYTETDTDPLGDVQTIATNADLSASYDASQYDYISLTMTKPVQSMITINYTYNDGTDPPLNQQFTVQSWIPSTATQPSIETDVDNGNTTFPGGCAVPSRYGTSGNQIVQTIKRVDAALGNLETETITTYVVPTYGPVCSVMTDNVSTFYDYTGQFGYLFAPSGTLTPVETTSMTETLTLSSASSSVSTVAAVRRAASSTRATTAGIMAGAPASVFVPLAFARSRFEKAVREQLGNRHNTFKRGFFAGGVHVK
jgi:hypothetical protein